MPVLVVDIRRMGMGMVNRFMQVHVAVAPRGHHVMRVRMVSIVMTVGVLMLHLLVSMFMPVTLGQMQKHPRKHQKTAEQHQPPRRPFTQAERHSRTDERSKGEHGAGPRRTKSPLRQRVEPKAQAISRGTNSKEPKSYSHGG